ncbi:MAG: cob(I)yrinic acid a,c-diamide adenosyltransferase [Bacteriovoracaceae bacterium]|nr:cob(I)yrinic acid a,c-diamide adenosyltransferase [Bacteriovoracaceae bacterium]
MKIYTKTGDTGQTSLVGGTRISKSDARIELYGEVDELNSFIGVVSTLLKESSHKKFHEIHLFLNQIQSALFDLGSNLACEKEQRLKYKLPIVSKDLINDLEKFMDEMQVHLPTISHFILPGGGFISAQIHLCRTVTRRVERRLVHFSLEHQSDIENSWIILLNRLSDYFFVLARFISFSEGKEEIFWIPNNSKS